MWKAVDPNTAEKTIKKSFNKLSDKGIITWETFRDTMLEEMNSFSGKHIPIGTVTSSQQTQQKKQRRWGKKSKANATSEEDNENPWIIFFVGGVAYNEIREIRSFAEKTGQNIFVGGTEILDAKSYMMKFDEASI